MRRSLSQVKSGTGRVVVVDESAAFRRVVRGRPSARRTGVMARRHATASARDVGKPGHLTISRQKQGCRSRWYQPRHDAPTATLLACPGR